MSHPPCYHVGTMKKSKTTKAPIRNVELVWAHCGQLHRVDADYVFTRDVGDRWEEFNPDPTSATFSSAADLVSDTRWAAFLEFMPIAERNVIELFDVGRLAALAVVTRCPGLVDDLLATPALVSFLAEHVRLRGTWEPRWEEINAVHERGGIYAVLEWLGLPASKQTLIILQKITDPDLSRCLLEPVRAGLWEPETIWLLQHASALTEQELQTRCHALAA